MKIRNIRTTPLHCAFKQPYHWAQGVNHGAPVILIEVETDAGIVGIGESVASPAHRAGARHPRGCHPALHRQICL